MSNNRLTNDEYAALANQYAENPPELTGMPSVITIRRQKILLERLVSKRCARIINTQAEQQSVSPSDIIERAINFQIMHNA